MTTVARRHGVEPGWVTTMLLEAAKTRAPSDGNAREMLRHRLEAEMNPSPRVFARVLKILAGLAR